MRHFGLMIGDDVQVVDATLPVTALDRWQHDRAGAHLNYDGRLQLRVSGGRKIETYQITSTPKEVAELPILGGAFGHLFHQRGALVIHGTTVAGPNGRQVILSGPTAHGKSTTAAAGLILGDFGLVADDLTVVEDPTNPIVRNGPARLRLWPDTVAAVGLLASDYALVHPENSKVWVDVDRAKDGPLVAMLALERGTETALSLLSGSQAVMAVVRGSFVATADGFSDGARLLEQATTLASRVRVFRLTVVPDLTDLRPLVTNLERALSWE